MGRHSSRRLPEVERVSHHGGLSADSRQRVVPPTVTEEGEKAPGLRFGHPRGRALFVALTLFQDLLNGFRHRHRREHVAALLGSGLDDYTPNQMTCDLRRLLRPGIICRQQGTSRYFLTPPGGKLSGLFARLEARVFRPARAAFGDDVTGLPPPLRNALRQVDSEPDALIQKAVPLRRTA